MNEQDARTALLGIGISPNGELVRNWLRANGDDEEEDALPTDHQPDGRAHRPPAADTALARPNSKSSLEPLLRESGQLERPQGPRKPGRPRIVASWFEKVAITMADGTSLKAALVMNGLKLSKSEVRACYRNKTFQAMYQETRRRYMAENYGRKPTLRALIGRYV
jgi:hypothetical protein